MMEVFFKGKNYAWSFVGGAGASPLAKGKDERLY